MLGMHDKQQWWLSYNLGQFNFYTMHLHPIGGDT